MTTDWTRDLRIILAHAQAADLPQPSQLNLLGGRVSVVVETDADAAHWETEADSRVSLEDYLHYPADLCTVGGATFTLAVGRDVSEHWAAEALNVSQG